MGNILDDIIAFILGGACVFSIMTMNADRARVDALIKKIEIPVVAPLPLPVPAAKLPQFNIVCQAAGPQTMACVATPEESK